MKRHLILSLCLALIAPLQFTQGAEKAAVVSWQHEPVTLDGLDVALAAELVKNPTKKLRLINVWATWCVPCVAEFPSLVKLSRELKDADFELITISIDHPRKDRDRALKFLQDQHAGMSAKLAGTLKAEGRTTNNYIYTQLALDPLIEALDKEWPGPVPQTILVLPGGEIIFRQNGEINPKVITQKISDALAALKK